MHQCAFLRIPGRELEIVSEAEVNRFFYHTSPDFFLYKMRVVNIVCVSVYFILFSKFIFTLLWENLYIVTRFNWFIIFCLLISAKFLIQPKSSCGIFIVEKGHIKIFGADDATAALLKTEFPELQLIPTASTSAAALSSGNSTLYTSQEAGDEPMELDEAFTSLTAYLNALDQQDFTVVSAFKDDLVDKETGHVYKVYIWTMQK